jgi:hypothetical protein
MIIDTDAHEAESFATPSQDLYPQVGREDRDRFVEDQENIVGALDDNAIVWRFAQGKKRLVVNPDLRIDYAHNSLQLSTPTGELIAIHKIAEKLHYILVKKDSKYSEMIQDIISKCQFIPIDTVTAERGFVRYQKYEIPAGYQLRYESAEALWQMWQAHQPQPTADIQLDILILARLKWYRVQQMICIDDRLDLQTRLGLISFSLRDRIAWIAKLGDVPAIGNADLIPHPHGTNGGTDSDILGKIISRLAIEAAPEPLVAELVGSEIDFDSNATMSRSIFSQPHDSSLYDLDRSSTLTGNIMPPISEQLRADTLSVLEDYLEHGETIVRTETIVDAQGNIVSEKTVSIHRGCPRWAIEAIINS